MQLVCINWLSIIAILISWHTTFAQLEFAFELEFEFELLFVCSLATFN